MIPKRYALLLLAVVLFAAGFVCHRFHWREAARWLWMAGGFAVVLSAWAFYVKDA